MPVLGKCFVLCLCRYSHSHFSWPKGMASGTTSIVSNIKSIEFIMSLNKLCVQSKVISTLYAESTAPVTCSLYTVLVQWYGTYIVYNIMST